MGEWKGSPRKQIIQKLVELFKEDPTFGLEKLVRRKTGPSGMYKKLFEGVEAIDEGGAYLKRVNQTKKLISNKLQEMKNMSVPSKEAQEFEKVKNTRIQRLADIQQQKANVRADVQTVIEDVGGSGEVRRQRKELEKAIRVMQQKRPFEN